jgi:hypothetical protein
MGDKPDGNAGQAAEQMATQLFSETSPFRNALYGNWANFLRRLAKQTKYPGMFHNLPYSVPPNLCLNSSIRMPRKIL